MTHWKGVDRKVTAIALAFVFGSLTAVSGESEPAQKPLRSLRIVPSNAAIWGAPPIQHFVVIGRSADGLEQDVTSEVQFTLSDSALGQIDRSGKFVARGSGAVALTAKAGGQTAKTTIRIEEFEKPRPFTFVRDIGGILTKRGCNDTNCHGGVKGRGGLRLSIFGIDPREDYKWIVEGGHFRVLTTEENPKYSRVNSKDPEKSLLLLKPTMSVAHGGGLRLEAGSEDYRAILNWVREGAPYGEEPEQQGVRVERVEVIPAEAVLQEGQRLQLVVTGYLSNGKREDLTEKVRYLSNDEHVVDVSDTGMVTAKTLGETHILVRTPGHTLSADIGVIQGPVRHFPKLQARNYIDEEVLGKLRRFHVLPSELSGDAEFLRRVCLDLTGTLPPPHRVREFIADSNPQKRDRLIDALLSSPEFVDYWSFRFGDLLRATFVNSLTIRGSRAYQNWIANSLATNKPYDQLVRERIAAQGFSAPARNFYYVAELTTTEVLMPELIRLFMGRRIECAQCHNHPFETWSQNQYWGLAAFFAGYTEVRDAQVGNGLIIDVLGGGHVDQPKEMRVANPRTKEKVDPTFLDGTKLPEKEWMDPRMHLARWATSHPYFAEASANRVWSFFFGRGLVEPVDDFRSTNPVSHPKLLQTLAKDFRDSSYDLKRLMKTIVQSRTYQLSATPNASNKADKSAYSHAQARPLEAAVLLDAVTQVTGSPEAFEFHRLAGDGAATPGTRAIDTIADICPSQFMDNFGRSTRKALPAASPQPNLLASLHRMAGPAYNEKIVREGGRLSERMAKLVSDEQILDEFYLAALTRFPTPTEKAELLKVLSERPTRRKDTLASLVWAILNSREFAYNH
ncbi:MAG: DUF1549 domain-containing protein [Acidimicrobiia bacterium]|nr:DUF1549 domain-containing protein [Acidimicrobiia bacterium]